MKKNKKILVVGDFSVNQFYYGFMKKIAKDAPVPIIEISKSETSLGSNGIICESLARFGINVIPIGIVGNDHYGKWILQQMTKLKIPTHNFITNSEQTSINSRIIVDSNQICRFDQNKDFSSDKKYAKKIFTSFKKNLRNVKLVVLTDYGLGVINEQNVNNIIHECIKRNIDVFVSSTGHHYRKFVGYNVMIKINLEDSFLMIGEKTPTKISSKKLCNELSKIFESQKILLTKGKDGCVIYNDGEIIERPATHNKVIDIKGIGEIMIASILMHLLKVKDFEEACEIGNIAAGLAVSIKSVKFVTKNDILKAKKEYDEWFGQK